MCHYRLYIMDSLGHHIEDYVEIAAKSDDDAIVAASTLSPIRPSELWLLSRRVHGFPRRDIMSVH